MSEARKKHCVFLSMICWMKVGISVYIKYHVDDFR